MQIKVFNDSVLVHEGTAEEFLKDNDHDEDIAEILEKLKTQPVIEAEFYSGLWRFEQKSPLTLPSQTDHKQNIPIQSISQPKLLARVCDADLATINGVIAYARELIKVGDLL